jgi:uncharacterized protein (DUF1778 family)
MKIAELARKREIDILLDQRLFDLDPDKYDAFASALANPPPEITMPSDLNEHLFADIDLLRCLTD